LGMLGYLGEIATSVAYAFYIVFVFSASPSVPVQTGQSDPVSFATPASVAVGMLGTVAGILVSLAWFYAGREKHSGLFKATGVVGLLAAITSYALTLWTLLSFPRGVATAPSLQALGLVFSILAVGGAAGILALTFVIMEIVTFFSAARVLQVGYFRYAGFGRVFAIVGGLIIIVGVVFLSMAAIFSSATFAGGAQPNPQAVAGFTKYLFWGTGIVLLIWAIPDVFAFLGFRRIPKDQVPPPNAVSEAAVVGS